MHILNLWTRIQRKILTCTNDKYKQLHSRIDALLHCNGNVKESSCTNITLICGRKMKFNLHHLNMAIFLRRPSLLYRFRLRFKLLYETNSTRLNKIILLNQNKRFNKHRCCWSSNETNKTSKKL